MIYNNCQGDICSNCGECCTDFLPVSPEELETIKRYVKDHNIKETIRIVPSLDVTVDITCPFRDPDNKICKIYEVRPAICKRFMCNKSEEESIAYRDILLSKYGMTNFRREIYGNDQMLNIINMWMSLKNVR